MRVLLTGGSGFVGSHLAGALRAAKGVEEVLVPRSSELDLRDQAATEAYFAREKPDAVVHAAGKVGGIGANRARPAEFFRDNLLMGMNAMHSAWKNGAKKFVTIGTVCSYPKFAIPPFKEEDLWNGYPEETNAPYGVAKKALLVQGQAYRAQYGFNAVFLIPTNMYGPGDNYDLDTSHVIAALIRKFDEAAAGKVPEVTLWGDGSPTREFLYVEDAARAVTLALEKYDGPEPVNLGTGEEVSIKDLAAVIAKEIGYAGSIRWDTSKPNGQPRRSMDTTRARQAFGFSAEVPLAEGIRRTIADYRKRKEK